MDSHSIFSNHPISADKAPFIQHHAKGTLAVASLPEQRKPSALKRHGTQSVWKSSRTASRRHVSFADDLETVHTVKNYRDFPLWRLKNIGSCGFDDDDSIGTVAEYPLAAVSNLVAYWIAFDQAYDQMAMKGMVDACLRQTLVLYLVHTDFRTQECESAGSVIRYEDNQLLRRTILDMYGTYPYQSLVGGISAFRDPIWSTASSPPSYCHELLASYCRKESRLSQQWAHFKADLDAEVAITLLENDVMLQQPPLDRVLRLPTNFIPSITATTESKRRPKRKKSIP